MSAAEVSEPVEVPVDARVKTTGDAPDRPAELEDETKSLLRSDDKTASLAGTAQADGDNTVCNVCKQDDCDEHNPLVWCDKCDVCVHRDCYGYPLTVKIPEDEWVCDRCAASASSERCALCPVRYGVMKRTTDWKWAHLSCALWIPEVFFRGADGREPIDYLQIPAHRWGNKCCHCGETHGAVMTCANAGCNKTFHITCGMAHQIFLEYKASKAGADVIVALCSDHSKKWQGRKKGR